MIHSSLISKGTRENEIHETLNLAMEQSIEKVMLDLKKDGNTHKIDTVDDFMYVFLPYFFVNLNSDIDVSVKILSADIEHGLFSVQAEGTYLENDTEKTEKTITIKRNIILEQDQDIPIVS